MDEAWLEMTLEFGEEWRTDGAGSMAPALHPILCLFPRFHACFSSHWKARERHRMKEIVYHLFREHPGLHVFLGSLLDHLGTRWNPEVLGSGGSSPASPCLFCLHAFNGLRGWALLGMMGMAFLWWGNKCGGGGRLAARLNCPAFP